MTVEHITSDIEILPAQRPAQADAIGQLMAHAQAMTTAKQLADALCDTDLVPAIYKGKPGNGAAAILYGAEIGLITAIGTTPGKGLIADITGVTA